MKFKTIYFTSVRIKELADFLHVTFPFLNALGVLNVKLKDLLVGLALAMKELDESIPKISLKGETRGVNEKDDYRDSEFLTFRTFVEAFTHSRNPTIREQAMLIYDTLKANGYYTLNGLPLNEESTAIRTLDGLFKESRLAGALMSFNAKPIWQNVVDAQDDFEGVKANRSELKTIDDAGDAATVVAKRTRAKCAEVFELIEALYMVEGNAQYANTITKINQEIDALNTLIRTRATNAAKARMEEEQKKSESKPSA